MPSTWQQLEDPEPGEFIPFPRPAPHPERLNRVRSHLLKLAVGDTRLTAIITMAVADDGSVHLSAAGIEAEHAHALLDEIDAVRFQLQAFLADQPRGPPADVVPFRR